MTGWPVCTRHIVISSYYLYSVVARHSAAYQLNLLPGDVVVLGSIEAGVYERYFTMICTTEQPVRIAGMLPQAADVRLLKHRQVSKHPVLRRVYESDTAFST